MKKIDKIRIDAKGFTSQKGTKKIQKKGRTANKKTVATAKKLRL